METNTMNQGTETTEVRDNELDISALLKSSKEESAPDVKEKSNLEKLKEAKANGSAGLIVNTSELDDGKKALAKSKSESDAMKEMDAYMKDQDTLINAAKNVNVTNRPKNEIELASLITSLDMYAKTGDIGTAEDGKTFIAEKTEGDVAPAETSDNTTTESTDDVKVVENAAKQEIVNIIIDKTGLGGDFKFDDEEKDKIINSNIIRLKEVEEVDLKSIKIKKKQKSFIESVNEFQLAGSKVPVVFPASRFRAEMTGLSFGEMGDISLNSENVTVDQVRKKLTVIYNKMVNPSIGKFESFEDFLRKFSYMDIDIAVYGLVVASFPEVDDIPLTCNDPKCGKSFSHKFSPRTLIRFNKAHEKFLSAMKEVIECPAEDAVKLSEESPTRSHKRIKLPYSGIIVEIGFASSYEYLYTIIDNLLGDKFAENHPDDVNGILQLNSTLLSLIRTVYVPDGDEYVEYDEFEDMINVLYHIKPEEVAILSSLLSKFTESYTVEFELTDIVCPHCGTKTESIPLDVNYLVFLKYQRLMSTEIDIDRISVL